MPAQRRWITPEEERRIREAALDETLANTFPASDPPSTVPNPAARHEDEDGPVRDSMTDTRPG